MICQHGIKSSQGLVGLAWAGQVADVKQKWFIKIVKNAFSTGGHRAECIAMVAIFQRNNSLARLAAMRPIPNCHFQCHFNSGGTTVGKKHFLKRIAGERQQGMGQFFGWFVAEPGKNNLFQTGDLILNGGNNFRVAMPVGIHPP